MTADLSAGCSSRRICLPDIGMDAQKSIFRTEKEQNQKYILKNAAGRIAGFRPAAFFYCL